MNKREDIRNIAIIAHVDHGKTTIVDEMLKQSGTTSVHLDRVMDSGDIEKERGITILAKNTSIKLPQGKINIVDTPGHMDFGGEVERTLQMVEGFLLLVDAAEGPLPGTRFVLQKALQLNLKPMVLINKIDRKDADIARTEEMITDLFLDLVTDDSQLDFPVLFGSGKNGFVSTEPVATSGNMQPLFDAIFQHIPAPVAKTDHLQLLITNLDHSDYLGRIGIGKVYSGSIELGQQIVACHSDKISSPMKVTKIYQYDGLNRVESDKATFGDIIAVTGFEEEITIGTTICDVEHPDPVPYVNIDKPTLSVYMSVNTSPFAGKEGTLLTSRQIGDRLDKEIKTNLALEIERTEAGDSFKVSGRGQLHLGILIEEMRREGFELGISAPEVIYKTVDGAKHEPFELLTMDVEEAYQGPIMEMLGRRKGLCENMVHHSHNKVKLEYKIPARGLIGFRSFFITETRGTGLISHRFHSYGPYAGRIERRGKGALVSMEQGKITAYALDGLQQRGVLFAKPTDETYQGQIIGEHNRDNDLDVNPTRGKKLTNMRASGSDDAVKLSPPKLMTLEMSLDWINDDELIEVTPKTVRLRKKYLKPHERKRAK